MRVKSTNVRDLREELRGEAARVAIDALLGVCRDPKAPAQAKATAGSTLLRFSGLDRDDDEDAKPLSELTAAELNERAERGQLLLERLVAQRDKGDVWD